MKIINENYMRNRMKQNYRKIIFSVMLILLTSGCAGTKVDENWQVAGFITGVHHLGPKFFISNFSVNKQGGGNVGPRGGGNSYVCCLMIPAKWYPGLSVDIKWQVRDWLEKDQPDTSVAPSGLEGSFTATVPFEEYGDSGGIYVHFFEGGKVRIVTSMYSPNHANHPVARGDTDGGPYATTGTPILVSSKK